MDSVTRDMANHEIRISSIITVSRAERGGDRLTEEMIVQCEVTPDDPQKR
jgi:hypothetical protein